MIKFYNNEFMMLEIPPQKRTFSIFYKETQERNYTTINLPYLYPIIQYFTLNKQLLENLDPIAYFGDNDAAKQLIDICNQNTNELMLRTLKLTFGHEPLPYDPNLLKPTYPIPIFPNSYGKGGSNYMVCLGNHYTVTTTLKELAKEVMNEFYFNSFTSDIPKEVFHEIYNLHLHDFLPLKKYE
jgi:hypothetical protein